MSKTKILFGTAIAILFLALSPAVFADCMEYQDCGMGGSSTGITEQQTQTIKNNLAPEATQSGTSTTSSSSLDLPPHDIFELFTDAELTQLLAALNGYFGEN